MNPSAFNSQKVVVISGAGLSAPSGLPTFRDNNGYWKQYRFEDVASPRAWASQPGVVLEFYNERRTKAASVEPNAGHRAIAELEDRFEVVVVTQNVDDLHERAGSTRVIHLHGELNKARSTSDESLVYELGSRPIALGDLCEKGSQLRPHIVWFGEEVKAIDLAANEVASAGRVLVVGTSLKVYPAAGLCSCAHEYATKFYVDLDAKRQVPDFTVIQGSADVILPDLLKTWTR
ncbi:Sir2 family NAD-dependent protein deacetylase [Verrucomicrobium sp. BvORR106]|uniref:SIR2 family NAD-dependent protein deacylase n=1 Tax=Verrucomicrobium sp. BvORR106 TaxID=1403819 RepID=UPI000570BE2D|nr:Sir2 family NAD-dependent protein deacetylase [Verrucomicrobium sp. BvORR106]